MTKQQYSATLSRPARAAVILGVPTSLVAVAALSYEPQRALGEAVGWGAGVAWLLPVAVIVCELVSTVVYFSAPRGRARRSAATGVLMAIGLSYGLSSTWHVLHPGNAPLPVTLAVSAVPNLVAALMLHIALTISGAAEVGSAEPQLEVQPPTALPAPELAAVCEEPASLQEPRTPAKPRRTSSAKAEALAFLRKLPEGELPSAVELAAKFDRTDRWGRDVLAEFRELQPIA